MALDSMTYAVYLDEAVQKIPSLSHALKNQESRDLLGSLIILIINKDLEPSSLADSQELDIYTITDFAPNQKSLWEGVQNISKFARQLKAYDAANMLDGLLKNQWRIQIKNHTPLIIGGILIGGLLLLNR
jgi:hypothetical protein